MIQNVLQSGEQDIPSEENTLNDTETPRVTGDVESEATLQLTDHGSMVSPYDDEDNISNPQITMEDEFFFNEDPMEYVEHPEAEEDTFDEEVSTAMAVKIY